MKNITDKIKVFISSKIGTTDKDLKYLLAREAVKEILEAMDLFEVYTFENEGASIVPVQEHYTYHLENSDMCIVLIDNADGIPAGVQSELDTISKHNIPTLYYFCDNKNQNKTALQLELEKNVSPKYKVIHSFKEFIEKCPYDLIKTILIDFKSIGKNNSRPTSLELHNSNDVSTSDVANDFSTSDNQISFLTTNSLPNSECRNYFSTLLLQNRLYKISESNKNLDYYCTKFLTTMFEYHSIEDFNIKLFLDSLKEVLPKDFYTISEKRWYANQKYYLHEYNESLKLLKSLYESIKKNNKIPKWLVQDILIDLRNMENKILETENKYTTISFGQRELDKRNEKYYYPILDKNEKDLLNWIENERQNNEIMPYDSWKSYGDLSEITNYIADFYKQAMLLGSFTQLSRIYILIQKFSYQISRTTLYWPSILMMMKTTIINFDNKGIEQISRDFNDILKKMNAIDAKDIFDFTRNIQTHEDRFRAELIAMGVIGYYLNDSDFETYWSSLEKDIVDWKDDDNSMISMEENIFDCIKKISIRLKSSFLISFACNIISSKKIRLHNKSLDLLSGNYINYRTMTPQDSNHLIDTLIDYLDTNDNIPISEAIKSIFILVQTMDTSHIQKLESYLEHNLPDFYENEYCLEKNKDIPTMELMLNKNISEIKNRNHSQGDNGIYHGFATDPYTDTINIIEWITEMPDKNILSNLLTATAESIISVNQTIEDKLSAYKLIIYLLRYYPTLIEDNVKLTNMLINNKNYNQASPTFFNYLDSSLLNLGNLLLLECLKKNNFYKIVEIMSSLKNPGEIIEACKLITIFLKNKGNNHIKQNIQSLFYQYSVSWSNSENIDVRYYNVDLQLSLYLYSKYRNHIGQNLYSKVKLDNALIVNKILHRISIIENDKPALAKEIKNLAAKNNNYVIRKMMQEDNHSNI